MLHLYVIIAKRNFFKKKKVSEVTCNMKVAENMKQIKMNLHENVTVEVLRQRRTLQLQLKIDFQKLIKSPLALFAF